MYEFLELYGIDVATITIIIATLAPFIRKRIISDKNLMSQFTDIKQTALKVNFKENDITQAISNIDKSIGLIENEVQQSIKDMNSAVLEFQESDIYQKMLNGLDQLDELKQTIDNKNDVIKKLGTTLKSINKRLGVMENERKL